MTRELLPFEAYDRQIAYETPRWRVALTVGVTYVLVLLLLELTVPRMRDANESLARLLIRTAASGALFGLFWAGFGPWLERHYLRKLVAGDPTAMSPAPGEEYALRITSGLLGNGYRANYGHLYAGPSDWLFVPQRGARRREREPVRIDRRTLRSVRASSEVVPAIAGFFRRGPRPVLRIETTAAVLRLTVPRPDEVAAALQAWIPATAG